MKHNTVFTACALTLTAIAADAQDLKTEVVVDRTVEPAERAATRLGGLTPELVLPAFQPVAVKPSVYTRLSPLTRSFTRLDPADGPAAAEPSPYRGYAALGYFPVLNLGAAAGYRILDTDRFDLGVHLQAGGERYEPIKDGKDTDVHQAWNIGLGVDFAWWPDAVSTLSAAAGYDYLRQQNTYWNPQNINSGNVAVGWDSEFGNLKYDVGVSAEFEDASDAVLYLAELGGSHLLPGLSQQQIGFEAEGSLPVGGDSRFGVAVDGDFVHTGSTLGAVGVTPFYSIASGNLSAKVGIKVDFGAGGEDSKVHIAPDLRMQWAVAPQFAVNASVAGGSVMNPFSSLRQECVYQVFTFGYGRSDVPVLAEVGLNFGPFAGFSAGLFGGYAKADGWLMMNGGVISQFAPVDIDGWRAGLRLGCEWRFLSVGASAEIAPSEYDKAWLYNRDRAKYVIGASAVVRPLEGLALGVDYEFRDHREAYYDASTSVPLGCKSELAAEVTYRVSKPFTVFARAENLLSRSYMMTAWEPSKKICGLIGVDVKF